MRSEFQFVGAAEFVERVIVGVATLIWDKSIYTSVEGFEGAVDVGADGVEGMLPWGHTPWTKPLLSQFNPLCVLCTILNTQSRQ